MSKEEIQARVDAHVATFKVGDLINTLIDTAEVDGRIVSIDGRKARIKTAWGTFTCDLSISSKL